MKTQIRRLFSFRPSSIKFASAILAISAILSNALGLIRNIIFYRLVPPAQLDVYYASFRVSDLIFNLFILSTMQTALIPLVADFLSKKDEEGAWRLTNQIISWSTLVLLTVGGILAIFMEPIVGKLVSGFDPERLATTVTLSRILLVQALFFGWSYSLSGLLNGYHRFGSYALAPLVYNLSLITGGILYPSFGLNGMIGAVVLGALLHGSIQLYEVRKIGFRIRPNLAYDQSFKEVLRLMWPRSVTQGVNQAALMVYTKLASGLQAGSLAIYNGMNDLQTTPTMIVGNSMAAASYPTMSKHIATGNWDELNRLLTKTLRLTLYLLFPSIMLLYVFRAQIVRLYFGIGGANWELTQIAILTFAWFLIGIIPAALTTVFAKVYYAMKNSLTPLWIQIGSTLAGMATAYLTIRMYGWNVAGLAAATSLLSIIQAATYFILLKQHDTIKFDYRELGNDSLRYMVGSVLLGASSWLALQIINYAYLVGGLLTTRSILGLFLQTVLAMGVGIGVYLVYSRQVTKEELGWILRRKNFSQSN